jgi:hypothetical protein
LAAVLKLPAYANIDAGGCASKVRINGALANLIQLSGNNQLKGLDIRSTVGPALKNIGGGNKLECTSIKVGA